MKKLLKIGLILIGLTFINSCEKEPETDIGKIENELKSFVSDNGITTCTIILMSGETYYTEYTDVDFSIGGGFVCIKQYANGDSYEDRYNLLYLSKYRFSTDHKLVLYFADTHP